MAMNDALFDTILGLVQRTPESWLAATCEALRNAPPAETANLLRNRMPDTNNADLSFMMSELLLRAEGKVSWDALSWSLKVAHDTYHRIKDEQHIELLWSGPSPDDRIPSRRIDQVLYDLIASAKNNILLVTFAASKIERLTSEVLKAIERGVNVRLILEFAEASEGQLTFDAYKAFPAELISRAEIYYWPTENRERNQAGKPGKLHAKLAVVDAVTLISSANLTDDAFTRNLELGVMIQDSLMTATSIRHIDNLITKGIICRLSNLT